MPVGLVPEKLMRLGVLQGFTGLEHGLTGQIGQKFAALGKGGIELAPLKGMTPGPCLVSPHLYLHLM